MGVSIFPHTSSLLLKGAGPLPSIPLNDGSWKAKWSFFLPYLSSPTSLGPRTLQKKNCSFTHHPPETHRRTLHTSSHQQFAGEHGWMEKSWRGVWPAPAISLLGKRRQEGGKGEKTEVQENSAAQRRTGPGQYRVRHNLRLSMPNNFSSAYIFFHNIIVVLIHHPPALPGAHLPWHSMSAPIYTQVMNCGEMAVFLASC